VNTAAEPPPPTPKKVFIVLNPVSGVGDATQLKRKLEVFATKHHWEMEVHETQEDENINETVACAIKKGPELVIAAGGDGTISAVACGMVNSEIPMAVLPFGTGNMLALELGIPIDANRALDSMIGKTYIKKMDMMAIEERYFILNAGVGVSSQIMKNTARKDKRRFGMLAYIWVGFKTLLGVQPHTFRITVDDKKISLRASEILIANGGLLGIKIPFEDLHVYPDDGKVDIFIIKARTPFDYLELLYYIIRRKPRSATKMIYLQAEREIRINARKVLPTQADGEVIGETPITIRVVPSVVQMLLPIKE
jgi:YegS/Rv2252/BmrU family lipid kinase